MKAFRTGHTERPVRAIPLSYFDAPKPHIQSQFHPKQEVFAMKPSEVVSSFMAAIEAENFTKAESLVSDKLEVHGVSPTPLGKKEYLGVHWALSSGLPDFKFNHKITKEEGDVVHHTVQITGTHTREMQAPIPGMQNIPATGKSVNMPEETVKITVAGDQIVRIDLQPVPDGGIPGLLKQIGVDLPKQ
jgi:SnoaL-like polyketide cyclase